MAMPLQAQIDGIGSGIVGMRHWLSIQKDRPKRERETWENSIRNTQAMVETYEAIERTLRWIQANEAEFREFVAAKKNAQRAAA